MTEETKLRSQELLERAHAARLELDELIAEQRQLDSDLARARVEDHEARMESVRSGGAFARRSPHWLVGCVASRTGARSCRS